MPADTFHYMILGYSTILGVLLAYIISLALRIKRIKNKRHRRKK